MTTGSSILKYVKKKKSNNPWREPYEYVLKFKSKGKSDGVYIVFYTLIIIVMAFSIHNNAIVCPITKIGGAITVRKWIKKVVFKKN